MHPVKKITKEDTWNPDDLKPYLQGHNEETKRRERSKRDEEHKTHRDRESLDRRHRDPDRDARREKEKQRDRMREGNKHRDPDRERNQKDEDKEYRYREKRSERENRDREKESKEVRQDRDERESERRRDKERKIDMYKEWDREKDKEREREREKRRAERNGSERERRKEEKKEGGINLDHTRIEERVRDKDRERERERRERHRARESEMRQNEYEEKQKGEKRERRSDKEHKEREHRREREDREKRRRDKESNDADTSHFREPVIKDGDRDREREERHRRRERRHKEESDSKRKDKEQKDKESSGNEESKRTTKDKEKSFKQSQLTWRTVQAEMSDPEIPVENEETEEDKHLSKDYNDYEEDFEDYEEDFEVDDDDEEEKETVHNDIKSTVREEKEELSPRRREEIEAIQRAIDEENERIYTPRSKPTIESSVREKESHLNRGQKHGKIIDFVSAKQREVSQKMAKKQKKRSEELLRLIDLDFSITFSLLDLPPVNEYDMYIKNFGTANTKQAYVQCNEDNTDRDIQTEEVDMTDKWTQHPPETKAACGGPKASHETADESIARMTIDTQRLTTFLRSATQVMAVLIEENNAESNSLKRLRSQTNSLSFSDGCLQLNTKLPFLHGRQVSLLLFSQVQRQTLLSVHPPSSKTSAVRLDSETVICVWNMWEPSRPQKILLYESEVKCCCFSPGKVDLVFAGTAVGSIVVWDLREHSGTHFNLVVGTEEWILRYPTFSTDAVLSGVSHLSPVVSIEPVLATAETSSKSTVTTEIEESLGLSFQLASLDENGVLTLWVVVELPKGNDSGSQTDLGLRPGGKVKLLYSSSLQTTERLPHEIMACGPPSSLQLKFLPSDSSHYFIATNMGLVKHGTRHSLKVSPKYYRSQFDSCSPVEVTTLDFSPSEEPLFLVGCSDGTIRLHSVLKEDPLMEWTGVSGGSPILSVQWSQTRPAVFCVLDATSNLYIWDLAEKDHVPVITENIHSDRVTAMAVFGDPDKQNTFSGIALGKQSGKVEIQYFKNSLTVPNVSDKDKLHSVLQDAI